MTHATPQIIDFCLGANVDGKTIEMHVEFLKRLPSIIHFAVRQGTITDAQIDLIWRCTWRVRSTGRGSGFHFCGLNKFFSAVVQ